MHKTRNNSPISIRTFSTIVISASTIFFGGTGCMTTERVVEASLADCGKAYQEGRKKIRDAFDDALSCCRNMLPGDPSGYATCVQKVEQSRRFAQQSLNDAHQACVDANTELLTAEVTAIFEVVDRAIKAACEVIDVISIVRSGDSDRMANLTSPVLEYQAMAIDLNGTVTGLDTQPITPQSLETHQRSNRLISANMQGTIKGMNSEGIHDTSVQVRMVATLPRNARRHGTIHNFLLELHGMPAMEIAEGFASTLKAQDDGGHLICAVLKPRIPFTDADAPIFGCYVEIPIFISGARARAGTSGAFVDTESIMPVAPNAIADWNRDFMVDLHDYEAFLQDFGIGLIDLNADGVTDERDLEIFEERFNDELGG